MRALLIALLFAAACTGAACALLDPTSDFAVVVEPTQPTYRLTDSTEVRLRIRNTHAFTIFFDTCGEQRFEKLEQGRSVEAWTIDRPCECLCIVRVKPGEQKDMTAFIREMENLAGPLVADATTSYRFSPVMYREATPQTMVATEEVEVKGFRFIK